uniref:KIB1-4 beta-propeller domain-containing protein n=1 Tax=Leersia perrieri TaxID=77586 RepID=A0A0D9WL20_9ORYZ
MSGPESTAGKVLLQRGPLRKPVTHQLLHHLPCVNPMFGQWHLPLLEGCTIFLPILYILSPCHLSTSNQIYLISLSIALTIALHDLSKITSSLRCSAPRHTPNSMRYLGCSYGYLIFSNHENCLLVDVYTGAKVGTNSWSKHPFGGERILQIVLFKGEMFVMDFLDRLHTMRFAPQLSIHEVSVAQQVVMVTGDHHFNPWLVVCDEMLLMVHFPLVSNLTSGTFQVFRLDTSAETTKWTKMEKLENQALFLSLDRRSPTFSRMNPERWGGKSNHIYISGCCYGSWNAIEIGQLVRFNHPPLQFDPDGHMNKLESLWVLPSFVYGVNK